MASQTATTDATQRTLQTQTNSIVMDGRIPDRMYSPEMRDVRLKHLPVERELNVALVWNENVLGCRN